ncbi:LOW QUALITY PROTEIN: CMRF35-like molecule 5 [Loxodonta africana]|uniref:LOW QUALITY PROTEIN: CMRF35-like molecule 5 n=1 Tax=Loxodonta africana TaxID=9785 RepID=UPI0030D19D22
MDLCFPGCSAISGPKAVSGPKRGSLTVRCSYGPGWETYYKWWCRGAVWNSCKILVKTTGSEKEVKKDAVSIRDSQKNRIFLVTMENLREDDAGFYWCGIEKPGTDLGVQVKVSIGPGQGTAFSPGSEPCAGLDGSAGRVVCNLVCVPSTKCLRNTTTSTNTPFTAPEDTTAFRTMTSQRSKVW